MLIAIAVLFVLYLSGPQRDKQKNMARPQIIQREPKKATIKTEQIRSNSSGCPHKLGYLRTRKEKSVPEECVGCAKLVKCLLADE
jgi:hypothetical protein